MTPVDINEVKEVFDKKKDLYKDNYHEMLGDYNRENETIGGYNGRQILELIQNCDDEEAKRVHIKLDKVNQTISIRNDGTAFSLKGYRSLSISNLSSKLSKKRYIGNKGLGFRSIINWSEYIKIISNDFEVMFSDKARKATFESLFDVVLQKEIREEHGVKDDVYPIPFLSSPTLTASPQGPSFSTTIEVKYKVEYYNDIVSQIKALQPNILLFLRHIESIEFETEEGLQDLQSNKTEHPDYSEQVFSPKELIVVNGEEWEVFSDEQEIELEENDKVEKSFYELKVAVKKGLSDRDSYLHTFFPTQVKLGFPYLVHATLDLDQNRNYLNKTEKNKIVLSHLVKLQTQVAKYFSAKEVDWTPYELLAVEGDENDKLKILGFYDSLKKALRTEAVYPCVDGNYRKCDEVRKISEDFSDLVIENGGAKCFPLLLKSGYGSLPKNTEYIPNLEYPNLIQNVNQFSETISDIATRVEFIGILHSEFPYKKFNFLVDDNNVLIDSSVEVFTPASQGIKIPSYCNISFINTRLYYSLLSKLKLNNTQDKSREFQRSIKNHSNISSYEPTPLNNKIISSTNTYLNEIDSKDGKIEVIREMLSSIYHNYKLRRNQEVELERVNIPLLDSDLAIFKASELYFSDEFLVGQIADDVFSNTQHKDRRRLASLKDLGLENENLEELEKFFKWLGVNEYVIYQHIANYGTYVSAYKSFIKKDRSIRDVDNWIFFRMENILDKMEYPQFILWFFKEELLRNVYNNTSGYVCTNREYNRSIYHHSSISYLKFIANKLILKFDHYLLDDTLKWLGKLNGLDVEYEHELFKKYNISKSQIDYILSNLGAKDEFEDLPIGYVTECIEKVSKKFPQGKNAQTIYKKAVGHFEKNNLPLTKDVLLFADNGENKPTLKAQSEIYFSDKVKIPNKLKSKYPFFHYPLRAGGAKAIQFFKIKDASTLSFDITEHTVSKELTDDFTTLLNKLKPYLLVYRIDHITKSSQQKEEASALNKVNIHLCSKLSYKIKDEAYTLSEYEFIPQEDNNYFIRINGDETLKELRKNQAFLDAFADIICHAFDFKKSRNDFRNCLKDDLDSIKHTVNYQYGEESVQEALKFLNRKDYDVDFWIALTQIADLPIDGIESIEKFIHDKENELGISLKHLSLDEQNCIKYSEALNLLFNSLGLSFDKINQERIKVDFIDEHKKELKSFFEKQESFVRDNIWKFLEERAEEQKDFLDLHHKYSKFESFIDQKSGEVRFVSAIDVKEVLDLYLKEQFPDIVFEEQDIDLEQIRKNNESGFTASECYRLNQSKELRSLIYFSIQLEGIKEVLRELEKENKTVESTVEEASEENVEIVENIDYSIREKKEITKRTSSGPYVPSNSPNSDRIKKQIGDNSEDKVYKKLVEMYGKENVFHISKMNEGAHYDIRYTLPDSDINIYVEVKTLTGGEFYLTEHEKLFGEKHRDNYELWLVEGTKLYPIKDFFKKNHTLTPVNYKVSINIKH
ncbi:DUF3883 domain-containing protein [Sediminitomix flava]|uniref:Uncharacterized protein DUF3883 n=1 Tax=Sediminitomix flava TaxID=379075 RepID=A0A315ZBR7_SEDFL|nr:DUF3883 domain-containing protein [Sediminitomix flava]PWJ42228.1 uncharacterized protein DUF3883 [Sediminitomix flava]